MAQRDAVRALHDVGEVRIADVEDREADGARLARDHRARERVRPVAERIDGFLELGFDRRGEALRAVDVL